MASKLDNLIKYKPLTILITGGSSGIGYQAALNLISLGHNLILPCKNIYRANELLTNIFNQFPSESSKKGEIFTPIMDLSDLNSIDSLCLEMKKRRLVHRIGVIYDTEISKMEIIPKIVEYIIESVDDATFDRCHFVGFGSSSLDFEIVYYIPTNNYTKAMAAQQNINLKIMKKFQEEGIEFAFPTQTINLLKSSEI